MTLAPKPVAPLRTDIDLAAQRFMANAGPAYVSLEGIAPRDIHYAATGFADWLARTPPEEQARWTVEKLRNPAQEGPDDGFIRRRSDKPSDQKCMFHVRDDLTGLLEAKGVALAPVWKGWLECCISVKQACVARAYGLAQALDRDMPGFRLFERLIDAEESDNPSVLRVLRYDPGNRGFAKRHTDVNAFSFHLGASDPGLFFVEDGAERSYPEPEERNALAFTGRVLEEVTGNAIKACEHGTRPCENAGGRWAVVCFVYLAK